jgi:hypothetical protein
VPHSFKPKISQINKAYRSELSFHLKLQAKKIEIIFVRNKYQIADIFTKGLEGTSFDINVSKLGLTDVYNLNLRGVLKYKNIKNRLIRIMCLSYTSRAHIKKSQYFLPL